MEETQPLSPYEEGLLRLLIQKQNEAFAQRDKNLTEQAEYLQFSDALDKVQHELEKEGSRLTVMMDLGCNFYTEAVIDDPTSVIVNLGKNIHAELTISEAKRFVSRKIASLKNIESTLSDEIAAAKAAYKLLLGLKSVENFPLI